MAKIAFEIVNAEVDRMFNIDPESMSIEEAHNHCKKIADFVAACGWDESSFIEKLFGFGSANSSN